MQITVRDRDDSELMDSVLVSVGSKHGYTDRKGYIEFDHVPSSLSVVISKNGYYTQVKKVKPVLKFRLSKKEGQSPISSINNGLYERPAEHFSGSATVVSGRELRKVNSLNFAEALQYYDPAFNATRDQNNGDNPNVAPDIKIRGTHNFPVSATIASQPGTTPSGVQVYPSSGDFIASSISNTSQPVFFVNGMQVSLQSALDIDINRIEKVTILKDAAATAVYGVRGGRGVVLIQTMKPRVGKMTISYSGQVQVSAADLSSYQLMDAKDKLSFEQDNSFYASDPALYQARQNAINQGVQTDWLRLPLRNAIGSKHTLALEGSDGEMSYGLDFSYNDFEGVMKGASRKTNGFGGYISSQVKNVLFSNYISFYQTNALNSPYGSFDSYAEQNAYWNPFDTVTGKMQKLMEKISYGGNNYLFYNPAFNGTLSTRDNTIYSRLANTTNISWNIGRGFKLNGFASYSRQTEQVDYFLPPSHTQFADYQPADFFKRGQYDQITKAFTSIEGNLRLNYNRRIGLHQLYASAGGSAIQTGSEATGITVIGFTSDKLADLAFGSAYSTQRPATGKINTRLASGFGNLFYSYDNRYKAEVSGNADASSQFANDYQVAPHWSAAASWNLHQERFFHANKFVDQFRLRASIGTTGDQAFMSYLGRSSYNYITDRQYIQSGSTPASRGIGLGAYLTSLANDSLRVPETYKQNIGFDAVLLQNRLSIRVDAYRQKSTDIILPVVSPAYTGFQGFSYYDNLGAIENKGLEVSLNYYLIRNTRKSIYWNVSVNGVHNEDRIVASSASIDKFNETNDAITVDQTMPQQRFVTGQSITGIWAVRSLGLDATTGKELFVKRDGSQTFDWSAADKILAGDLTPRWLGTFGTSVMIKNISAGIYFNYQMGVQGYNQTLADKVENANMLFNVDARARGNRWTHAGDEAQLKPVSLNGLQTSPTYATSRFVQDNDFVNCSAVSIEYAMPQALAAKIRARSLRLGLMGNNLFRWQAMKVERGIYYPFQQQYSFSIHTTF